MDWSWRHIGGWFRRGRNRAELADIASLDMEHLSEAELHAYVDDALEPEDRMNVEAFFVTHPDVAERTEIYRAQTVVLNMAFNAGEDSPPAALCALAARYERRLAVSAGIRAAFGVVVVAAILVAILELMLSLRA